MSSDLLPVPSVVEGDGVALVPSVVEGEGVDL